jgi:hypothetical protein
MEVSSIAKECRKMLEFSKNTTTLSDSVSSLQAKRQKKEEERERRQHS